MAEGYLCLPVSGDGLAKTKNDLRRADGIENLYFTTISFSDDSGIFFQNNPTHYMMARHSGKADVKGIADDYSKNGRVFSFSSKETIFDKGIGCDPKFLSSYYFKGSMSSDDMRYVIMMLAKNPDISSLEMMDLEVYGAAEDKFKFPYGESIAMVGVTNDFTPQKQLKRCEKIRREVCRKGREMANFTNMPLLQKLG